MTRYFIAFLLITFGLLGAARADTGPRERLGLSRICVSEAGWNPVADCPAILSVLRSRADRMGVSLYSAMRAYSRRTFNPARTDSRRWIADLQLDASKPRGWPAHVAWGGVHDVKWRGVLAYAGELLASDEHPCDQDPHHWAAPWFDRPRRLGWERVECSGAVNAFWRVRRGSNGRTK